MTGRFPLGQIVATPGALQIATREEIDACLRRHATGDWGVVDSIGRDANDEAVSNGSPIMSIYECGEHALWIITEGDPRCTTVLTPAEYYNGLRTGAVTLSPSGAKPSDEGIPDK